MKQLFGDAEEVVHSVREHMSPYVKTEVTYADIVRGRLHPL